MTNKHNSIVLVNTGMTGERLLERYMLHGGGQNEDFAKKAVTSDFTAILCMSLHTSIRGAVTASITICQPYAQGLAHLFVEGVNTTSTRNSANR
jgi:hypothetical protein